MARTKSKKKAKRDKQQTPTEITASVVNPAARDRLYAVIERAMLPHSVESVLATAMQGDLRHQWLLFVAMIDSWPRLQKNLSEVGREAAKAPYDVRPFAYRNADPTPEAVERAELVEDSLNAMLPDPKVGEMGYRGLLEYLGAGYYQGHILAELRWNEDLSPRAAFPVDPRFYGYPRAGEDRLMLNLSGHYNGALTDFSDHKFLIGVKRGHSGHASVAAPMRSLVGYWMAANFGLKWLMQFAQVFGMPLRWATYPAGDDCTAEAVANMLDNMGTAGWGAFPEGTNIDLKEASKSAQQLPQKMLIDMADRQCDTAILGQTLTSDVGSSGSRALGEVHEGVRHDIIEGVSCWIADIINTQFIPSIIALNYGPDALQELPCVVVDWPEKRDEKERAETADIVVNKVGITVGKKWLYEHLNVPMPEKEEEVFETKEPVVGPPRPIEGMRVPGVSPRPVLDRPVVDQLTDNVLQSLSGTAPQFLAGVRPFFRELVRLALDGDVNDADFDAALRKSANQIPELFESLDVESLQIAMEEAMGTAMLAGAGERILDAP